jgi:hypothetical protein
MYQLLHGPAIVGRHDIIAHKYDSFGEYTTQLATCVGEQEASRIAATIYIRVMDGKVERNAGPPEREGAARHDVSLL